MPHPKRIHPKEKPGLHERNLHRERYDFKLLVQSCPALQPFVTVNKYQDESIDFSNPEAVKMLNKALLKHFYGIEKWEIPAGYLCPPIPGRAEYLHHMADLLATSHNGIVPTGQNVRCFDIGVGANCIYPLIGFSVYGWSFVGSEIDELAVKNANQILENNPTIREGIEIRRQPNASSIFNGVLKPDEHFDLTICNPPFHGSFIEARSASQRKVSNLTGKTTIRTQLNFGGQNNELWCEGGEAHFVRKLILQSKELPISKTWFSSLVSRSEHLKGLYQALNDAGVDEIRTIPLNHGNKTSRILAWNFSLKQLLQG
jgi:23S rRNA (adenine1618-N6)-methyltransferase